MTNLFNTSGVTGVNLDTVTNWEYKEVPPIGRTYEEAKKARALVPQIIFHHIGETPPTHVEGEDAILIHRELFSRGAWHKG